MKIHHITPEFPITNGVRQEDKMTPKLPTATLYNIFHKLDWENTGLSIDIIAKIIQVVLSACFNNCNAIGLKMIIAKTEIMFNEVFQNQDNMINDIKLEEVVEEYALLGHLIHT